MTFSNTPRPVPAATKEPLDRLARFTFDWAGDLCDPAHGCADYHRSWSLVRLLESGGALPLGVPFFHRELRLAAGDGGARVLVSGAADTGLPAIVAGAFAGRNVPLTIVMADRCKTPIEQARLYAASIGVALETHQGTLDTVQTAPVDAIVAHSFLPFIPAEDRPTLFAAWSRLLRSGGRVLLNQRIQPADQPYRRIRPVDEMAERRDRLAVKLAQQSPVSAPIDTVLDAAHALWTGSMGGRPITERELSSLADGAGMDVARIDFDDSTATGSPFESHSQSASRKRAEIVIIKR